MGFLDIGAPQCAASTGTGSAPSVEGPMSDGMRSDESEREDADAAGACAGSASTSASTPVANLVAGGER